VFITVVATLITLLFNAMAAFALKYRFGGRDAVVFLIIDLDDPADDHSSSQFPVRSWAAEQPVGRHLAGGGHAHGVFLLRQYMLTIRTN
jgi:alpha-1,4-digalacturonate transport system permease protein